MAHLKKIFEEELVKVENGKWISPHIYYVKPLNEWFIIPFISFSSLLASIVFENFYVLIWASYPSHKMCMKEENNKKSNNLSFLKIRTKFWWAFTPEKFMFKNWKWNQRSYASFLFIFLPCSTEYNQGIFCVFHCPNVGKWHNSESKLPKYLLKAE